MKQPTISLNVVICSVTIPQVTDETTSTKSATGTMLLLKLLGKSSPVALSSIACGTHVSSSITIDTIRISADTSAKARRSRNVNDKRLPILFSSLHIPLLATQPYAMAERRSHTETSLPIFSVKLPKNHLIPSLFISDLSPVAGKAAGTIHDESIKIISITAMMQTAFETNPVSVLPSFFIWI